MRAASAATDGGRPAVADLIVAVDVSGTISNPKSQEARIVVGEQLAASLRDAQRRTGDPDEGVLVCSHTPPLFGVVARIVTGPHEANRRVRGTVHRYFQWHRLLRFISARAIRATTPRFAPARPTAGPRHATPPPRHTSHPARNRHAHRHAHRHCWRQGPAEARRPPRPGGTRIRLLVPSKRPFSGR